MKRFRPLAALLLCLALLGGCGAPGARDAAPAQAPGGTLTVGVEPLEGRLSPFFPGSASDRTVVELTQLPLLTLDRSGAVVQSGTVGEPRVYGQTEYRYDTPADLALLQQDDGRLFCDVTLREDLVFSDGTPVTADDVIFSLYVLCDPAYDGGYALREQPIEGLAEYRAGVRTRGALLLAGEDADCTPEQAETFRAAVSAAGTRFAQEIVDYCARQGYGETAAEAAAAWGYDGLDEDDGAAEFFALLLQRHGCDPQALDSESAGSSFWTLLREELGDRAAFYDAGVESGVSATRVTGIRKTGTHALRIVLTETDLSVLEQLRIPIAPLHYYGSTGLYDYDADRFGFPKGDLALIRSRDGAPLGAGPYCLTETEDGSVTLTANTRYYRGAPATERLVFRPCAQEELPGAVANGTVDLAQVGVHTKTLPALRETTAQVLGIDDLGYGYVGISANRVHVGASAGSAASKNLRRAFATVFAACREPSVRGVYGDWTHILQYPISATSWAAPKAGEADYKTAFSTDVGGRAIYTETMDADARAAAAAAAALGYLEAAGYTVERGRVTEAPRGGRLEYTVWLPQPEHGRHPLAQLCEQAAELLGGLGLTLKIRTVSQEQELWSALAEERVDLWCAGWDAVADPDLDQVYGSDGAYRFLYDLADEDLDRLLADAKRSVNQTFRKALYKAAMELVMDWAVEIPVYQRQTALVYDPERVDAATFPADMTAFYGWTAEIHMLKTIEKS